MFENEEWREIEEAPHYQISNYGRVKSDARPDRVREVTLNDRGFPVIVLYGADSKTRYLRQINVLVAKAFCEEPYDHKHNAVWHLDGNLRNCNAENLKWEMRARVLEWNEMHRRQRPSLVTPQVRNNRSGITYENAYECGMAEGRLESDIVWRVERQARHMEDPEARYMYVFKEAHEHGRP